MTYFSITMLHKNLLQLSMWLCSIQSKCFISAKLQVIRSLPIEYLPKNELLQYHYFVLPEMTKMILLASVIGCPFSFRLACRRLLRAVAARSSAKSSARFIKYFLTSMDIWSQCLNFFLLFLILITGKFTIHDLNRLLPASFTYFSSLLCKRPFYR